jgi:hypothetical protein
VIVSNQAGKASLLLSATKTAGGATQSHTYSFSSGVSFTVRPSLSTATLFARLGRYGTVKATFRGSGALATKSLPPPCTGPKFQSRTGSLVSFGFTADTTFFRKVAKSPLAATISRLGGTGNVSCGGAGSGVGTKPPAGGASLAGFATGAGTTTVVVSKDASGAVTQTVTFSGEPAQNVPTTVSHMITTQAQSGSFTFADDLSSATVTGAGPFLSGNLNFTSTGSFGNTAAGTLSGDYTAKFDSVGPQSPASSGALQGTLTKS